jgi:hypothetical protein
VRSIVRGVCARAHELDTKVLDLQIS